MRISWGRAVVNGRWIVVAVAAIVLAVGVGWGGGVFKNLVTGGFDDPGSQSSLATKQIAAEFGPQNPDVIVTYSSAAATIDEPGFRDPLIATVRSLRTNSAVASVLTYYDTGSDALVSNDRHATYIAIRLSAVDDSGKRAAYDVIRGKLSAPGLSDRVGGNVAVQASVDAISQSDIARGEAVAMPIVLILLTLIFGGLIAGAMPLLIGILAILGAFTTTRMIANVTEVSTFAINSITLLGLGMAIDYSLLMISRFREELEAGRSPRSAVIATVASAGRTVLVSGATVALSLASLLIFPQVFLRSMALGGMAAVLIAMVGALTVLPALLFLVGARINALRIPLARLRPGRAPLDERRGAWARLAHSVMRRPVRYVVAVLFVLATLALPLQHVRFGGVDQRTLPAGSEPRAVADQIAAQFPGTTTDPIQTLIEGASTTQTQNLLDRVRGVPGITGAQVTAHRGDASLVSASYAGDPAGTAAREAVDEIRRLPTPDGVSVRVTGTSAEISDQLASLGERLPWMIAIMAAVTLVLLFFAFGSVLLPIKSVLLNVLSIGASFGVVVWGFQDGHLAALLGFTSTGYVEPTVLILMLAVLFGLATDYEVFLLSRVRERWLATGDNTTSVAAGLQRTGRIITAAALLLVVVTAAFATGQIVITKLIGVGMVVGIIVDATLVRAILVPATMRLLGRWNLWAPPRLTALHRRYGIREPAAPRLEPEHTAPVGAAEPTVSPVLGASDDLLRAN